nr:hypothetical protein [Pandoravirus aubagnensis]
MGLVSIGDWLYGLSMRAKSTDLSPLPSVTRRSPKKRERKQKGLGTLEKKKKDNWAPFGFCGIKFSCHSSLVCFSGGPRRLRRTTDNNANNANRNRHNHPFSFFFLIGKKRENN